MTKKEKFRNLITMFYNKVAVGQKFIISYSYNKFDKFGERLYSSGFYKAESFYKAETEKLIATVINIYLEELPITEHRVMAVLEQLAIHDIGCVRNCDIRELSRIK